MFISKIANLMKSYTTYHIWERYPNYLKKHLAAAALYIARHWHIEKRLMSKRKSLSAKQTVTECVKVTNNNKLNAEIKEIVAEEQVLRDEIDKIIAEIEVDA